MRNRTIPLDPLTPVELAAAAHLRYVNDQDVGYTRRRQRGRFTYYDSHGRRLQNPSQLARIDRLAIPPAWRDVWICRYATGHLQATGRDSRRRKQYLYHPRWSEISNLVKFWRLRPFGLALPGLRRKLTRILRGEGLSRERVLAGIVALLDATSVRVGNEEYVAENGSYGLTTLRDRHVAVERLTVEMRFVSKGGFRRQVNVTAKSLARLVKQARQIPGARLFQYLHDDGRRRPVTAAEVNDYLRELAGQPFTAKDFRTWKASALVAGTLYDYRDLDRVTHRKRILKMVIDDAAAALGNTPAICRGYYVHPGLLATYRDATFSDYFRRFAPKSRSGRRHDEQVLQHFLRRWESAGNLSRAGFPSVLARA
jgi:DNA topoisomerase-1